MAVLLPLEIEPMVEADLDGVAALEATAQPFPWNRSHFADSLVAGYGAWVLRQGGNLLGFLVVMTAVDEAHLLNVAVAPEHQGHGLGARLLRHAMNWSAGKGMLDMYLEVRPSNTRAEALYRHFGFHLIGRRKAYYPAREGREDALVFRRSLEGVLS
ncbi:ribosomal protein S18-alanine N-acetyltransferase [Azovibrio restrictus]|uniref:ribosomal protein S18-alanine N-acetyltransferase n=1 Tax=Azovibrio restrictus TaxID=146938 RepID=UPI0026EA7AD6|nr:ribosomal protein S18-alanine N-acetyltransferase [Azovibrio restrictus]MDD3483342.1 ribosomal protein S18-alanine N-acetyltransferase [Azovibrio restrictus]